ncbi:MAG: heme-binding protein [Thermosynechococcaceae cyanobacterium]
MKPQTILIIVGLMAIPVIGFAAYSAALAPLPDGFPQPTAAGKIEVKHYPAYRSGTYTYKGKLSQAANESFEPLFQHISSNGISMTAPVEARYPSMTLEELPNRKPDEEGQVEVSFLYRNEAVQPKQIAEGIKVESHASVTVVSIGVSGPYTYTAYQENLARLRDWLSKNRNYVVVGLPRRFFYDSPFIPDGLKRSEVQIPIQ